MLVIKMLKKASDMNNIELADYLGKTRNTIAAWEENEDNIPNTEKIKLSNRFNFDYDYWNIGLDKPTSYYQKMYSDIKLGYLNDYKKYEAMNKSRVDEILDSCDSTTGLIDSYKTFGKSNEYNHFLYINSLLNGIDPIDNSKLDKDHFIFQFKDLWETVKEYCSTLEDEDNQPIEEDNNYEIYLSDLKEWRRKQAEKEGIKPFQVVSDEVLKDIVKAVMNGDSNLSKTQIKNFPRGGKKWNQYYELIINELPF